ncbi:MAG: hypothetical protein LBP79_01045 [Clostridiales bacterium]|jgi:glycosyltransferase involved in cell wall biosynthesis|nr:hypothetical protein [Clostridiales bacterium]
MLITAHSGALRTGGNSREFFETISAYPVDAIEVDVREIGGRLCLKHDFLPFGKRALSLEFAFDYVKERGFFINCDMKKYGLARAAAALAEKRGVLDRVIFTGNLTKEDLEFAEGANAYLNAGFFRGIIKFAKGNAPGIKAAVAALNTACVKGVNLDYKLCGEDFLEEAKRCGLGLSLYTVDDADALERLAARGELCNITTNIPDKAIEILRGR